MDGIQTADAVVGIVDLGSEGMSLAGQGAVFVVAALDLPGGLCDGRGAIVVFEVDRGVVDAVLGAPGRGDALEVALGVVGVPQDHGRRAGQRGDAHLSQATQPVVVHCIGAVRIAERHQLAGRVVDGQRETPIEMAVATGT